MRYDDFRRSDNIEDRRDDSPSMGGGGFPMGSGGGIGIGGLIIVGLISWALGVDPRLIIGGLEMVQGNRTQQTSGPTPTRQAGAPKDEQGQFVAAILGDSEDRWTELFQEAGRQYRKPRLVMFARATQSACGFAQSAMGPFYCPNDQRIYLDTSFFDDLERKFRGCSGQACRFAQAYVITHEIGHHVQNLLGILPRVQQAQHSMGDREKNAAQVRVELQADCFAGLWASRSQAKWKFMDPGDIEAALQTASAIGDDRLQKRSQGVVVPDAFTHGSSAQRMQAFQMGLKGKSIQDCPL